MGLCNRIAGVCECYNDRDGIACERAKCPSDCSGQGICYTQKQIAEDVGRIYETPWDADKMVACVCDYGFRGLDCQQVECPSGNDIMKGPGNIQGRDCSGRGLCDYKRGVCECFQGYYGVKCEFQTTLYI